MGRGRSGRARVGGASTAAGVSYQDGVTAWLAAHVLAEDHAPHLPELPAGLHVAQTSSETPHPIDDINAPMTGGKTIYLQAKRAVRQLVDRAGEDFTDFIRQVVDEHEALGGTAGVDPDALYVLATAPDAAATVREDLRLVLNDLRDAPRGTDPRAFGQTEDKSSALKTTIGIVDRLLRDRGAEPTTVLLRAILNRTAVWVVDPEGESKQTAVNMLAASVVADPADAPKAWRVLEQRAVAAQRDHDVLDIAGWRRALEMDGIPLKAVPSFGADVERIRAHAAGALSDLGRRRSLRLGSESVHVQRDTVAAAAALAEEGPLVVLGDPGSGKSGLLADLASVLVERGGEVLAIDADALAGLSIGQVSHELHLEHDIDQVLVGWPHGMRRYLIVDALDQTRGTGAVAALRKVVERVVAAGVWTAIVAVRRFDLRYSMDIRRSFAGRVPPGPLTDREFADVRHVAVGDFSDAELAQVEHQAPNLVRATEQARTGDLLRRPLHLQLAADLLARDPSVALEHIDSQVQLLYRYWQRTVEQPIDRRAVREAVLTRAARDTVATRRVTVDRADLDAVDGTGTLELLGLGVLIEDETEPGTPGRVRLLHALIGDYATSRLVVRNAAGAEALLAGDPANALFLHQALELWLAGLWHADSTRQAFWAAVLQLFRAANVPEIARLVGPTLAADLWREIGDLEPLLIALTTGDRVEAINALRHFVASQTSTPHRAIAGPDAAPWPVLAVHLTTMLAPDFVFPPRLLVTILADVVHQATPAQAAEIALAARQLLDWLWSTDNPDLISAGIAIRAVRQTFAIDPAAAETLLRRGLRRRHVARRGFQELRHLVDPLRDLEASPSLIVAVYTAAFRFEDAAGSEPSMLRPGPVLPLVSNRGQEFGSVRYQLGEEFRAFMDADPVAATEALIRVVRGSDELRPKGPASRPSVSFTVRGVPCRVGDEWSAQSVGWLMGHGEEATMIEGWRSALAGLAANGDPRLDGTIDAFLRANRTYAGWRVLVDTACRWPGLVESVVALVVEAAPVLGARTMIASICCLIDACADRPELSAVLREAIAKVASPVREALASCLDGTRNATAMEYDDGLADDGESGSSGAAAAEPAGTTTPGQILRAWTETPEGEAAPTDERVRLAFKEFVGGLGTHDAGSDEGWWLASRAGSRLAQADSDCSEDTAHAAAFLASVVETATNPGYDFDGEEELATIPAHACVLDAVVGLAQLYAAGRCDEQVTPLTIEAIAAHDLPWARSQLARVTPTLASRDPGLAWTILGRLAEDPVSSVAADAVWMAQRLRHHGPDDARLVLDRAALAHPPKSKVLTEAVIALEGCLFIDGNSDLGSVRSAIAATGRLTDVGPLLHLLRGVITPPGDPAGPDVDRHRRALSLVREIGDIAVARASEARRSWESTASAEASDRLQDAARVLDSLMTEIYFASGAYKKDGEEPRATPLQMATLFDEVLDDLRRLLPSLPAPAVHHIIEIAKANADERPVEAFALVGQAVAAGQGVGYETDSLAHDLVLGLVRAFISERADLFAGASEQARAMQAALVTILDSFVSVGWPAAREMAYRLREVLA
jgi:hypothetical protein